MIEYDYYIIRNIGQGEKQEFVPNKIPSKLSNLVYIEAPNSSGKSTLLNLIALGFFGLKDKNINKLLRKKMESLINSDHQKIKFTFSITGKSGNKIFDIEKKELENQEIVVYEYIKGNKIPISYDLFKNNYRLIYDIPDNPIERIKDLSEEIRSEQLRLGEKISEFEYYLRKILNDISESRDPQKIEDLQSSIKKLQNKNIENSTTRDNIILLQNNLEKYVGIKYYLYYLNECITADQKITSLCNENKRKKTSTKRNNSRYSILQNKIENDLSNLSNLYYNVKNNLHFLLESIEKRHLKIWDDVEIHNIPNFELDIHLKDEIEHFKIIMDKMYLMESQKNYIKNSNFINQLINILKLHDDIELELPGLNINIKNLVALLEKEIDNNKVYINNYNSIKDTKELLKQMSDIIFNIEGTLNELKTLQPKVGDKIDTDYIIFENQKLIEDLEDRFKEYINLKQKYMNLCVINNIDINDVETNGKKILELISKNELLVPFFKYTEQQLNDKITDIKIQFNSIEKNINENNYYIQDYNNEIKKMLQKDIHKYKHLEKDISNILEVILILKQKILRDYNKYILKILNNEINELNSEIELKYLNEISKYLGNKIGEFKHIDKIYDAKLVDLKDEKIITKDNKEIRFIDMGTGQTQSAYIQSLLNIKDNRKLIVLFDEIAMMDDSTLKPIFNKIQKLYMDDKILLNIVVQKGNTVSIINLEEYI